MVSVNSRATLDYLSNEAAVLMAAIPISKLTGNEDMVSCSLSQLDQRLVIVRSHLEALRRQVTSALGQLDATSAAERSFPASALRQQHQTIGLRLP